MDVPFQDESIRTEHYPRKGQEKTSETENLQALISHVFSLVALTCLLQVF